MKELKSFTSSPLLSCVVEIRFKHSAGELVPGLVYSSIAKRYGNPNVENLPVAQLPQQIRGQDPNLVYQPTAAIRTENFTLNIGPRVIALNYDVTIRQRYPGWDVFFGELKQLVKELGDNDLLKNIERIGIRYVNFFQTDNFLNKLSVSVETPWDAKMDNDISFGFMIKNAGSKTRVVINTNATVNLGIAGVAESKTGQVLDLDTFIERSIKYTELLKLIDDCHKTSKNVFVQTLRADFIESMGPDYA